MKRVTKSESDRKYKRVNQSIQGLRLFSPRSCLCGKKVKKSRPSIQVQVPRGDLPTRYSHPWALFIALGQFYPKSVLKRSYTIRYFVESSSSSKWVWKTLPNLSHSLEKAQNSSADVSKTNLTTGYLLLPLLRGAMLWSRTGEITAPRYLPYKPCCGNSVWVRVPDQLASREIESWEGEEALCSLSAFLRPMLNLGPQSLPLWEREEDGGKTKPKEKVRSARMTVFSLKSVLASVLSTPRPTTNRVFFAVVWTLLPTP